MSKQITLTEIKNPKMIITFNHPFEEDGVTKFHKAGVIFTGKACNDGVSANYSAIYYAGTTSETEFTPTQIYSFIQANLGQTWADYFNQMYLDAINEDISE